MTTKKDDRTEQEKADWKAGSFDDSEAEKAREAEERQVGNPLAPPE